MIAKIVQGRGFKGVVDYVLGKPHARLIYACGVRLRDDNDPAAIASSFITQAQLNPRISKPVAHISLDFSAQDKEKLTDEMMQTIAEKYMAKMGYANTQYIMVRHNDTDHPHLHLILNRIDNDGKRISDQNERLRSTDACKELTQKYGLYLASGKENVKEHRLRQPDKTRYEIYHTLQATIPHCHTWPDLIQSLQRYGIGVELIGNGDTNKVQGVKFSKNGYLFNGSKVDRQFSHSKIDWQLRQNDQANKLRAVPVHQPDSPSAGKSIDTAVSIAEGVMSGAAGIFDFQTHGTNSDEIEYNRQQALEKKNKKKRKGIKR